MRRGVRNRRPQQCVTLPDASVMPPQNARNPRLSMPNGTGATRCVCSASGGRNSTAERSRICTGVAGGGVQNGRRSLRRCHGAKASRFRRAVAGTMPLLPQGSAAHRQQAGYFSRSDCKNHPACAGSAGWLPIGTHLALLRERCRASERVIVLVAPRRNSARSLATHRSTDRCCGASQPVLRGGRTEIGRAHV